MVSAAIEEELSQLDDADRDAFLTDLGLDEPGLNRVIRAAALTSFPTVARIAGSLEGYPSGQRGQTVNLLAYAFGGSNPPPSTTQHPGALPATGATPGPKQVTSARE